MSVFTPHDKIAAIRRCCDRDRVAGALKSIGTEAINEMAASSEPTEIECQFCNAKYSFTAEQLTALLC